MSPPTEANGNKDDSTKGKQQPQPKRRKRGGGCRNWKKTGAAPKRPPQTPQLKVTIRNIHNADLNGTVKDVGERIIRKLIDLSNEKLGNSGTDRIFLKLDAAAFEELVEADVGARKARTEWSEKQASTEVKGSETKEIIETEVLATVEIIKPELLSGVVEGMEHLYLSDDSTVHVRVLYVVPPKKTKRRGEKSGCAYLVLTAPSIQARNPLPVHPEKTEGAIEDAASTRSTKSGSTQAPADYSKDVARRRVMIQRSLDALIKTAEDDTKTRQLLSECTVEESLNGKTWKTARTENTPRRDRIEGTIEESADFKAFFERIEQEKDERKSRPRPAPGGGVASAMTTGDNKGQPLAALVIHLRQKQEEEEKKRKQGKKKPKAGNEGTTTNDAKGTTKKGNRKYAQTKKKKTVSNVKSTSSVAKLGSS